MAGHGPRPPRGQALLALLEAEARDRRDEVAERLLGIAAPPAGAALGADLVPYHPAGVEAVARAVVDVPVTADDLFVDLGSGLGKVVMLAHLLTGAAARGIELQPALVERATAAA